MHLIIENQLFISLSAAKEIFFRLINNSMIDWRKFAYSLNTQLICKVEKQSQAGCQATPRCIIVDYTDLIKTGRLFEFKGNFLT